MFSKINLTDDPEVASNDDNFIKNLGSIKIAALRGTETGPVYKSNQFDEVSDNRVSSLPLSLARPKLTTPRDS